MLERGSIQRQSERSSMKKRVKATWSVEIRVDWAKEEVAVKDHTGETVWPLGAIPWNTKREIRTGVTLKKVHYCDGPVIVLTNWEDLPQNVAIFLNDQRLEDTKIPIPKPR